MRDALLSALEWQIEAGADEALAERPINRTESRNFGISESRKEHDRSAPVSEIPKFRDSEIPKPQASESARLAKAANTLEELREAIAAFDGIALKKTATNLVFSDGNPGAPVMVVGEAPGADEDRMGKPFVGVSGQLLDRILKCIDLSRTETDPAKAFYISNILNWRPPGNRTPAPGEIDASLPFIERHIALVKPKILILCGGVSAKALLGSTESVSRLRRQWHDYTPLTPDIGIDAPIPAIATYHPAFLLRTPSQKRAVWQDMLEVQAKRRELGV